MKDKMEVIESIVEKYFYEADQEEEVTDETLIKVFYTDLDINGRKKVLDAIDASFDYIDVFSDDIVRENLEESLSKRPLLTMSGEELVNKMDVEL